MAKYFVMIDGEQKGPFSLQELPENGVGPDTYVWCKGMADWQQSREVADICRFYRNRLFDIMHPSAPMQEVPIEQTPEEGEEDFRFGVGLPMPPDTTNYSERPPSLMAMAILVTLLCFPVTGIVAIYLSYMSQKMWRESERDVNSINGKPISQQDREYLRHSAHDYARKGKMLIGISFFLGFIVYALVAQRL